MVLHLAPLVLLAPSALAFMAVLGWALSPTQRTARDK